MGRNDKLFQKRKAAKEADIRRKAASKAARKRVLIVCEGAKTEKIYFEALVSALDLTSVDVEIYGEGAAPISIVREAERRVKAEGSPEDAGYNAVFCVFDRDTHDSFDEAKSHIKVLEKRGLFPRSPNAACFSIPSIEYWFLIHFKYVRAPFTSSDGKSPGAQATDELRKIPGFEAYQKILKDNLVLMLLERMSVACSNASKAERDALQTGEMNPSTRVHELVKFLEELAT